MKFFAHVVKLGLEPSQEAKRYGIRCENNKWSNLTVKQAGS